MNRTVKRTVMSILALLIGLLSMTTSLARTSDSARVSGASSDLVATKEISEANQRAALAYWTRDAIAGAKPLAMPTDRGSAVVDAAALSGQEVTGPVGSVAASAGVPDADEVARAAYPSDWAALEESAGASSVDQPDGTPGVYTAYTVNIHAPMHKIYPHKWIGRLSFNVPGSGTSYCSATSISGNVMLTAAHCLYNSTTNTWYNSWVFSPAYRAGTSPTSTPYGTFAATTCWVLTTWVNLSGNYSINSWARHDVGVCKMGRNSANQTMNQAVGWMGRQWNYPYTRHFHDLGYPFRDYNNNLLGAAGQYLRTCIAESFQQTTDTRGMGCSYGGGISGGPWMPNYVPFNAGTTGNADGVNSGIYIGQQNIYGARFTSNNIVVLCNAAVC